MQDIATYQVRTPLYAWLRLSARSSKEIFQARHQRIKNITPVRQIGTPLHGAGGPDQRILRESINKSFHGNPMVDGSTAGAPIT